MSLGNSLHSLRKQIFMDILGNFLILSWNVYSIYSLESPRRGNHNKYSRLSLSRTRLSRSENLVPVLTQRSTNRQQNIVEKRRNCSWGAISPLFHNIFNISLLGVKLKIHSVKSGSSINCFPQFRKSDMSKYGYIEVFHRVSWISR